MLQDVKDLTSPGVIKGLNTQYNFLSLSKDQSPNMMDVKVNYDGSFEKRLGSTTMNAVKIMEGGKDSFTVGNFLTNGLIAWLNLDEVSGTRYDIWKGNNLTDGGNTSYSGGKVVRSALFNAGSGNVLFHTNTSTLATGDIDFSMSCWFYLSSTGQNASLIYKSDYDPINGLQGIDSNALLCAHMDTIDFKDSSYYKQANAVKVGNVQLGTDKKFGGGSFYTSSTGNMLQFIGSGNLYNIGTGDFTVDYWFRKTGGTQVFSFTIPNFLSSNYNANDQKWGTNLWHNSSTQVTFNFDAYALTQGTFYHIALARSSQKLSLYVDGTEHGSVTDTSNLIANNPEILIGGFDTSNLSSYNNFIGNIEEFRISNVARYYTNFTPNSSAYSPEGSEFEYFLGVNSNNKLVFSVSSDGSSVDGTITANSFGALTASTWYSAYAWHDAAGDILGLGINGTADTVSYADGVRSGSSPFLMGAASDGVSSSFSGRIDAMGFWKSATDSTQMMLYLYNSGNASTYQTQYDGFPWASFDFGASSIRWLTCAAGTGVYASSNLGVTWINIGTSQSSTYQYFDRSKNVLIKTSDAYDEPLYWAGSIGTYMVAVGNSAPLCKYNINFQGFLILLNSQERKRSFNYIDENYQLSSTAWLNFDIPSSADDEITAVFILRRYLYVSTRYRIFRVSYVGGNPDWQYVEIKSWGFMPRTVKKVVIMNNQQGQTSSYSIGEVVVGLTYDRKLRIFDGSGDQLLSSNVEKDNGMCEFALDKISYLGSGPVISFAELDPIPNVYRLCVAIGHDSTQTTHFLNYDGRSQALYPYSNMHFNCMCVAESANRQYLMAFDRSGYCHMMDSSNMDAGTVPINDYFESPLMFEKTPSQVSKGHKTDLFISNSTSGALYYYDRVDFSSEWKLRKKFVMGGSSEKLVQFETVDTPTTYNTYQFRISSSSGTSKPWRIQRYDHFTRGLGIGRNE